MLKVPELAGKVAIVTGSSSGIGYRLAVGLAEQGVKVVVNSRKLERLEGVCREVESLGGEVLPVQADVRDPDQVAALVEQTLARFGTAHFLTNPLLPSAAPAQLGLLRRRLVGRGLREELEAVNYG